MEIINQKKLGGYCPRCFHMPCTCVTSKIPFVNESHGEEKSNDEEKIKNQDADNAWKLLYRFMDNVKTFMDVTSQSNTRAISEEDVNKVIQYLYNGIQNITKNTIGGKTHYTPNNQEFAKMWNLCDEYHCLSLRRGWTWQEAVDFLHKHWSDPAFNFDYSKVLETENE